MVGPQQTTGLIGQKWKTGNGWELTGTNRPTQTTPPTPTAKQGRVGETAANREASTIRSTPNPPPNHTHTQVGGGKGKWATTPHNRINNTRRHHTALPTVVSVVTATGKRPAPSRTRKLSLTAPMVLHPPGCGRVGHHRAHRERTSPRIYQDPGAGPSPTDQQPTLDEHGVAW